MSQPTRTSSRPANTLDKPNLRVIPLGGLGEIGKNMTALEYGNDIIVLDFGSKFATDEEPGVDMIIPDTAYLEQNRHKIRGFVITHGHMDHIGAAGHLLAKIPAPVFGTLLTLEMVKKQIEEYHLPTKTQFRTLNPDTHERVQLGAFNIELVRVGHSIPDAAAIVIRTPAGTVIDTGDWRPEPDPIVGKPMDLERLREIADEGVTLLMGDSTNSQRIGTISPENLIGPSYDELFNRSSRRIIMSMFASNINRVQLVIDAAAKHNRKLAFTGRSMLANVELAVRLGYISVPPGLIVRAGDRVPEDQLVVLSTGSQGEQNSALQRMATGAHPTVKIKRGDTIILSSSPISGNEKAVNDLVDLLLREGATIFQHTTRDLDSHGPLHASGHAFHDDLADLIRLLKPIFHMPIHGHYAMQARHAEIAMENGIPADNVFVMNIGEVLEINGSHATKNGTVPSGSTYLDGSSTIDNKVITERLELGEEGMITVVITLGRDGRPIARPQIISRGLVHVDTNRRLMDDLQSAVTQVVRASRAGDVSVQVRDAVAQIISERLERNPVVLVHVASSN
jgi:ribonuclease J